MTVSLEWAREQGSHKTEGLRRTEGLEERDASSPLPGAGGGLRIGSGLLEGGQHIGHLWNSAADNGGQGGRGDLFLFNL